MNVTEVYLWELINGLSWYYWGPIAVMGALNLWNIYRLAPAGTLYGRLTRIVAIIGFLLIAASPRNTAFGPLAVPFLLVSYWMFTRQMYLECVKAGRIRKAEGCRYWLGARCSVDGAMPAVAK